MALNDFMVLEGKHYDWYTLKKHNDGYICLKCGKISVGEYSVRHLGVRTSGACNQKVYGTHQLMRLWAWYNFKRHLIKCHGLRRL